MLIFVTNQLNFLDVLTPRDLIFICDQTNIILATRERTNLVVDGCVRRASRGVRRASRGVSRASRGGRCVS